MKTMKKFLALFLVLGMLLVSLAVPASANSGTATYPNTADFSWGINGHGAFGSYGSMSVENQMALAAKLGVKLYRVDIASLTDLNRIDDIVMAANSYGMDVMLCMTIDTLNADTVLSANTSKISKDFKAIARHFKTGDYGRVKYFEIFNETENACKIDSSKDASLEASYDSEKITAMANAMNAAATAVKGQIPDAKIVINYGYLHDPYLKLLAAAGLNFDVIDIHWYTGMETALNEDGGLGFALARLDEVDSLKDKPVILGEVGVESSSQDIHGSSVLTTELESIMAKAYASDKVIGAIFYELLDYTSEQHFGFADTTGTPKEIYTSVQTLIGGNNDITAGTYTRSASFPTGDVTARAVTYDTGAGTLVPGNSVPANVRLSIPVNLKDSNSTVDFDTFVETDPSVGKIKFNIGLKFANGQGQWARSIEYDTNKWVHDWWTISGFNYQSAGFDLSNVTEIYFEYGADAIINIEHIKFTNRYPKRNNTYISVVDDGYRELRHNGLLANHLTNRPIEASKAEYVEFDILSEDGVTNFGNFGLRSRYSDDGSLVKTIGAVTANTWTHKVLKLSEFQNFGSNVDKTYLTHFYVETSSTKWSIANISFTKFAPEANNIFNNPVSVDAKIDFHNTSSGWDAMNSRISFTPVDISGYDYVEFDAYTEPGTTDSKGYFQIRFGSDNSNVYGQNGYGSNQPIQHNTWTHMVYALNKDIIGLSGTPDLTNIKNVHIIGVAAGQTVHIRNISFTKFEPEVRNVYYAPANTGIKIDFNNTTGVWNESSRTSFNAINTTKYQYVEYDVYVENVTSTSSTGYFQLKLGSSNDTAYGYLQSNDNGYGYIGYVPVGTWKHVVSSLSDFATLQNNPDLTAINNAYIAGVAAGQKVYMRNICFTMETEPPQIVWGDANGNGEVDILDLIRLKKAIANGDTIDNCDFDGTGESDAEDLTYLKQFILGVIDSLDPEDINA